MCTLEPETSLHFLGVCEALSALRYEVIGGHTLSAEELEKVPLATLAKFIAKSGRFVRDPERYHAAHQTGVS